MATEPLLASTGEIRQPHTVIQGRLVSAVYSMADAVQDERKRIAALLHQIGLEANWSALYRLANELEEEWCRTT